MADRMLRHIEIKDGDTTVAAAVVSICAEAAGAPRASLHAWSGHAVPGSRARLVDAILELAEVRSGGRLEATVPVGDSESLDRFRQRCADVRIRPAGASTLLDATPVPGPAAPPAQLAHPPQLAQPASPAPASPARGPMLAAVSSRGRRPGR